MMANLQAAMRNQLLAIKSDNPADMEKSLVGIMAELNQQIHANSPSEKYATLFLSRYDAGTRRLWYCNAGHLAPILLTGQEVQALEPTGTVIGLLPGAGYQAKSVDLAPGALLAIFTDGITEAVNGADEEFGTERLLEALQQSRLRPPEEVYRFVIGKVREWQGTLPQHDDMTLTVFKVKRLPPQSQRVQAQPGMSQASRIASSAGIAPAGLSRLPPLPPLPARSPEPAATPVSAGTETQEKEPTLSEKLKHLYKHPTDLYNSII